MTPAFLKTAVQAALAIAAAGLLWRVASWFRLRIGPDARTVGTGARLEAAARGTIAAVFSPRLPRVLWAFAFDTLLQGRLLRREPLRWAGHLLILAGFTALLVLHALAAIVAPKWFPNYQPTLDPFLFLRNVFGAMALGGVVLLVVGRVRRRTSIAVARRPVDGVFAALLMVAMLTGFGLEAQKIASPRAFYRMADQFVGSTDPEELKPLRAVWAADFGVAFDDLPDPIPDDVMEEGRSLHQDACASCHSKPAPSAFVSWPASRAMAPFVRPLDDVQADRWLYWIHVAACLLGLALLPFTRFFHAVADPVSLVVRGAAAGTSPNPAARANRRAMGLDACVGCGICDTACSVAPLARHLGNPALLPSHKRAGTRAIATGRLFRSNRDDAGRIAEGAFLCTDCGRCTARCPVGLDLEDLWMATRGDLAAAGFPAPAQWVQARPAIAWADALEALPETASTPERRANDDRAAPLSSDRATFSGCVQCQTCTNVCPVVAHSIDAGTGVDLTPQKVMNLLRMGMRDLALGSRMVWDCATCYQCQENCPEGVRVTDVMLELRGLSVRRLGAVRDPGRAS